MSGCRTAPSRDQHVPPSIRSSRPGGTGVGVPGWRSSISIPIIKSSVVGPHSNFELLELSRRIPMRIPLPSFPGRRVVSPLSSLRAHMLACSQCLRSDRGARPCAHTWLSAAPTHARTRCRTHTLLCLSLRCVPPYVHDIVHPRLEVRSLLRFPPICKTICKRIAIKSA